MKIKKLALLSLLSITLLASCGSSNSASDSGETTIFAMQNGKTLDTDSAVFKKAAEITGVKLVNVASQNQTDENQAYNLAISSKPLPDLISYYSVSKLEDLGIEGGLIPLEDLIKEHAPNIEKFFEENPRYKKDAVSVDGHIYMIPNYYDYFNIRTSQGYFIRKDWLKKLNLEEPKTVEDLYKVLVAFKEQDPNGNGKKDEVPFFTRGVIASVLITSLTDIFKASPSWILENNQVVYGPTQERYKDAVKELAKWYKEGLIDNEVFTRGMKSRDYMLFNNLGGFSSDWIGSTSGYNDKLKDKIPGFDFSIMLPITYKGDNKTFHTRPTYEGGLGISTSAKDPVKLIKYIDFFYSPEGRRLWNFGIEGQDYTLVDNKPVFTDKIMKDPEGRNPLQVLRSIGAQFRLGFAQDAEYEKAWATDEAKAAIELYMNNDVIKEAVPLLKYTSEESKEFVTIMSQIQSYVEEKTQQWILGSSDVEKDWPEFIQRLKELGLEKVEKLEKEAYERFNNQK